MIKNWLVQQSSCSHSFWGLLLICFLRELYIAQLKHLDVCWHVGGPNEFWKHWYVSVVWSVDHSSRTNKFHVFHLIFRTRDAHIVLWVQSWSLLLSSLYAFGLSLVLCCLAFVTSVCLIIFSSLDCCDKYYWGSSHRIDITRLRPLLCCGLWLSYRGGESMSIYFRVASEESLSAEGGTIAAHIAHCQLASTTHSYFRHLGHFERHETSR